MRLMKALVACGFGLAVLAASTGCVGYVGDGYGGYVETGPDWFFWGGPYERGHDVYGYSHRGAASRGFAHGGGGGGHGGGGGRH